MSGQATAEREWEGRKLHFIGIGGSGMSGIASVCAQLGAAVSGSDRSVSPYMDTLRAAGIAPSIGHDAANLPPGADVVVSTAIGDDNPELAAAREAGARIVHRGELLAELWALRRLIAVAGTHGKTTTTAMIAWALQRLGAEPSFFIGGEVPRLGPAGTVANAGWGAGEWAVAEADESDGSFLRLRPEVAVITNIELDHHARWSSLAQLQAAFDEFADGAGAVADFSLDAPGPAELALAVPGRHNVANARAALSALSVAGFDLDAAAAAIADFPGARRRLELRGERNGARVYDDYAHHPTEVRATLSALRELEPNRLVAVFQPHLYSRTKTLAEDFGAALALADEAVVLDVYAAREDPVGDLAGVDGLVVARAAADRMAGRPVVWAPTLESAARALDSRARPGTAIVTLGAGDVFRVAEMLVGEDLR